jgi:hypothetical protein
MRSFAERRDRPLRLELRAAFLAAVVAAAFAAALLPGGARAQDLARRVNAAIDRGRAALLPHVARYTRQPEPSYPMGYLALTLAAVLKAEVPSAHPIVVAAFEKLASMPPREVYSVACYLFALDALWQARYRESRSGAPARQGRTALGAGEVPRLPPPGPVRSRMEELVAWLQRGSGGAWNYGQRGGRDLSNSQFAVLGLEIGLENGIHVDPAVLRAVAEHLIRSHIRVGPRGEFSVVWRTPSWEGVTSGRLREEKLSAELGGWEYQSNPAGTATKNMTAAGVSSLFIARRALRSLGELPGALEQAIDEAIAAGLGWITANVGGYWGNYYGMYSLEKVGDLGGIQLLGPHDWYQEGAVYLVGAQKRDGSWGSPTDTAFALLFLTRATRSPLQTLGPPVTTTQSGEQEGTAHEESDLVYIPELEGFLSARVLFGFLAETRDPKVTPLAAAAANALPPHRIHEAVDLLLSVWGDPDPVTRFAAKELGRLTGVEGATRVEYAEIARELRSARKMEEGAAVKGEEAGRLLRSGRSPVLKRRVLEVIDRLGLVDAFETVVEALDGEDRGVAERAAAVLTEWASRLGGAAPPPAARGGGAESTTAWREWWRAEGENLALARRATQLLEEIHGARELEAEAEAEALRGLVALGRPAVPHLLSALEREEYSLVCVRALEELSGQSHGVRAAAWRAWWERAAGRDVTK